MIRVPIFPWDFDVGAVWKGSYVAETRKAFVCYPPAPSLPLDYRELSLPHAKRRSSVDRRERRSSALKAEHAADSRRHFWNRRHPWKHDRFWHHADSLADCQSPPIRAADHAGMGAGRGLLLAGGMVFGRAGCDDPEFGCLLHRGAASLWRLRWLHGWMDRLDRPVQVRRCRGDSGRRVRPGPSSFP